MKEIEIVIIEAENRSFNFKMERKRSRVETKDGFTLTA